MKHERLRNVRRIGGGHYVSIPSDFCRALSLYDKTLVEVRLEKNHIVIEPMKAVPRDKILKELLDKAAENAIDGKQPLKHNTEL